MDRNSLDAVRVTALRTNSWLPFFRSRSGDERLEAVLGTPTESATAASLYVVHSSIVSRCLMTAGAVVKLKRDVVLAIDASASVAFYLEKVKFFAIPVRAAVANVVENSFVPGHPCRNEPIEIKSSPQWAAPTPLNQDTTFFLTVMNIIVSPRSRPTHSRLFEFLSSILGLGNPLWAHGHPGRTTEATPALSRKGPART